MGRTARGQQGGDKKGKRSSQRFAIEEEDEEEDVGTVPLTLIAKYRQWTVDLNFEIADNGEIQKIDAPENAEIHWLSREGAEPGDLHKLLGAVQGLELPQGDGYVFVAGESAMSKAVRHHMVDERGHNPDWIKAAGYWQAGSEDFDDGHAH